MELTKDPQTGRYSARIATSGVYSSGMHVSTKPGKDRICIGNEVLTSADCDELIAAIRAAQIISAELGA